MLPHFTGKGTFWDLRVETTDPGTFESFISTELEPFLTGQGDRSILLIRGDTTSEGVEFLMLLNGVLDGHAGVLTTISQHFMVTWKPLGVRTFNEYGEEKNLIWTASDDGQEKDHYGQRK